MPSVKLGSRILLLWTPLSMCQSAHSPRVLQQTRPWSRIELTLSKNHAASLFPKPCPPPAITHPCPTGFSKAIPNTLPSSRQGPLSVQVPDICYSCRPAAPGPTHTVVWLCWTAGPHFPYQPLCASVSVSGETPCFSLAGWQGAGPRGGLVGSTALASAHCRWV